jgi:SAM-dependent methyltransferase
MSAAADPWAHRGNLSWIEAQLRSRGLDPTRPTLEALAIHDQLHTGGLEATRAFLRWLEPRPGARVLELGAGLGGTARLLARDHDCRVTALERSEPLHLAGTELTRRVGLDPLVEHLRGDATVAPRPGAFDLVLVQHVDMHVQDKDALFRACRTAVTERGRVAWHDWLGGPGGPPFYPTPWSRRGEGSFLSLEAEHRAALSRAGFRAVTVVDVSARTVGWLGGSITALRKALDRPLPEDPVLVERRGELERLLVASENVLRGVQERRLVPFFGEAVIDPAWSSGLDDLPGEALNSL